MGADRPMAVARDPNPDRSSGPMLHGIGPTVLRAHVPTTG